MKKIVSLVIVLTMMLCMFPISSMTASAATTEFKGLVDLSDETKYPDGGSYTDTETGITYTVIRSASKLIELVKADLTGNYILAANIETTSTYNSPMFGNTNNTFTGVLDGNGFAIYGFKTTFPTGWSYQGGCVGVLFNNIGGNATIKNLSVGRAGENIPVTVNAVEAGLVGVIAGKVASSTTAENTVTISNVNVYANISYNVAKSAELCVGGIIGKTDRPSTSNTAYTLNINNTTFHGSISFTEAAAVSGYNTFVGGMIGYIYGGGAINIQRSSNYANINATNRTSGSKNTCVGGFIGNSMRQISFTDCVNFGNVTSDKYSAGFLGIVDFANYSALRSTQYTFERCTNHGNISSDAGDESIKAYAGGIMGYANFGTVNFNNCGNTGDISSSCSASAGASGILGRHYFNNTDSTFTNCYTTGTIISPYGKIYAICSGSGSSININNCVWNNAEYKCATVDLTSTSGNNSAKNILAKETANEFEALAQKSEDGTMLRVLLLTKTAPAANEPVVIKIYQGNTGKQFTVPASALFALEEVNAADEIYYGVGGTSIFGAVIKGLPSDVTNATVEYAGLTFNFDLSK